MSHPTQLGNFTGNDVGGGVFDPAGYGGYAPPTQVPGPYHGYPYPPSSSSGYTPSAVAAKAFAAPAQGGVPGSATTSSEPSRHRKLLKKLSKGFLRPTTDPAPGPEPAAAPTTRPRSKSSASQYQPISVEDFEAIVAETGSLSRYPALSVAGTDGALHAHPHKRLPEPKDRGRPSTREMAEAGVMRNPSRTPRDDPGDSDTDSSVSDPPDFGSDKTRWPAATPSDASHSTRYPAASAPVGVGSMTHAVPPGHAHAESQQGSIHSSWSRNGGRPRSYYDDADHYLSYTSNLPTSHTGHSASQHGVPGVAGSHGSAPVTAGPPPIAPSSGSHRSRHSHRHSISGHLDAERHHDDSSHRSRRSHRDRSRSRSRDRDRQRSRSRHSQASYKTYGSYSPVPFETPPPERSRRLSQPKPAKDDPVDRMGKDLQVSTTLLESMRAQDDVTPRSAPVPSILSRRNYAPSTTPSVSSTWSYHAPAPPAPGVVGSTASHHSTSPYTAPVQPYPSSSIQPYPTQPQPYDNPYRTSPTLSSATVHGHAHRHSVPIPVSSASQFHDMQNHGALVNPAVGASPVVGAGGPGYYQYAGWSAPPPGHAGSGGGAPIAPGSAGRLPPAQHAFIDHSRGVASSHSHTGSSHGSAGQLVSTRDNERGRDYGEEGRSRHGRGRSRSVDALQAARQKDYEDRMRILQSQGSVGSVGSRSGHRSSLSHSYEYPPGPYGVPVVYSASGHSHHSHSRHSPTEERHRDRDRERERDRDRDRERVGRSKSRERNVLRKPRSESRRRRGEDEDRERSKSRPRHREDFDELERRHRHERHIGEDEARDIDREAPMILKKSKSRPGSSSQHASSSSGSSRHHHSHSGSHHHHHSSSSHSPSHHRHSHRHSHSALVGSSASSRARHERRKESLDQQKIKPRFDEGAVGDPRRERESGVGVVYPVEVYPGKQSSRSREREMKKQRRATVSGVGSGWFPV